MGSRHLIKKMKQGKLTSYSMIPGAQLRQLSLDSEPDDIKVDFEAIWNLHPREFAEVMICGSRVTCGATSFRG